MDLPDTSDKVMKLAKSPDVVDAGAFFYYDYELSAFLRDIDFFDNSFNWG